MKDSARRRLLATIAVGAVIAMMWAFVLINASITPPDKKTSFAEALETLPAMTADSADTVLYYHTIRRMRSGEGYYQAAAGVFLINNELDALDLNLGSALSYRLPTFFLIMSLVPPGIGYVVLTLMVASVAVIAAYYLVEQFVHVAAAVASAALVAVFYASTAGSVALFGTEVWAGALGLASMALLAGSSEARSKRRIPLKMSAAAGVAVAAFAVRELSVAFIAVGLIATIADRESRRSMFWIPWVIAAAVAALIYVGHTIAVQPWLIASQQPANPMPWFDPDSSGLIAGVARTAANLHVQNWVGWVLLGMAMIGSVLAPRRIMTRVALGLVVIGGAIVLALFHPSGTGYGGYVPAYWADMVMPTALACAPLVLALAPRLRREQPAAPDQVEAS